MLRWQGRGLNSSINYYIVVIYMDVEKYVDFQYRLNEYATDISLNIEGTEMRRYIILLNNRNMFPELKEMGTEQVTQMMANLEISQIILPNDHLISSVGKFKDGFSIKGTNYNKFRMEYPEDAIRVERELEPNALMQIYQ